MRISGSWSRLRRVAARVGVIPRVYTGAGKLSTNCESDIVGDAMNAIGQQLERLDPVPPLHHRVHEQLEALIVSRAIAQGARIVESELAEQMGVSRGPVREALQLLARDGFVDLRPRQGSFVHVPTQKEVADFFDVRRALETASVRLAAERITEEQARELRAVVDRGTEMLEHGDDPSKA